jgi:hypothetical protein
MITSTLIQKNRDMENYYSDTRVLLALEKSEGELMDILTFIKEINFEIAIDLTFDVLWANITKNRYIYIYISLLEWLGYSGPKELHKQAFINLLNRNNIEYEYIAYQHPLIREFPEILDEIGQMRPVDKPRKKWLIMDTKNFKKAVMRLNTPRRESIQDYYLLLEELVQLYGAYTHKFKETQFKAQLEAKNKELKDRDNHVLLLKDLLIDDTKRERLQVVYISTSQNYARQNRSKPGGVEKEALLRSRLSTYNSRSAKGDEWYFYEWYFVADYRQVESRLKDVLGRFRDKKNKEMYVLNLSHMTYIVQYICEHYNDEVDEVNAKLAEFISGFDSHNLRPFVPEPKPLPLTIQEAKLSTTEEDGTTTLTTIQANSQDDFKAKLEEYILKLDSATTCISKKKVFDDLNVKKGRTDKLPLLQFILGKLRPNVKLLQKS